MKSINNIIETVKLKVKSKYIKKTAFIRKRMIKNKNFTIISNNCWGGFVYQSYALKYNTPTIGLFFMADDYLKFIESLDYYLSIDNIDFIKPEESKWYNYLKSFSTFGTYPIAKIKDIEIFCLHYKSKEEFLKKWNKRKKRVNYEKIIYKFSEMNLCDKSDIKKFQKLPLENKICFISKKYKECTNDYTFIVSSDMKNQIKSTNEPIGNSLKVNINKIINKL